MRIAKWTGDSRASTSYRRFTADSCIESRLPLSDSCDSGGMSLAASPAGGVGGGVGQARGGATGLDGDDGGPVGADDVWLRHDGVAAVDGGGDGRTVVVYGVQ